MNIIEKIAKRKKTWVFLIICFVILCGGIYIWDLFPIFRDFSDLDEGFHILVANNAKKKTPELSFWIGQNEDDAVKVVSIKSLSSKKSKLKSISPATYSGLGRNVYLIFKDKSGSVHKENIYELASGIDKHMIILDVTKVNSDGFVFGEVSGCNAEYTKTQYIVTPHE